MPGAGSVKKKDTILMELTLDSTNLVLKYKLFRGLQVLMGWVLTFQIKTFSRQNCDPGS